MNLGIKTKRSVESFLVATGNQALSNTANAASHLVNSATAAVRLANGQLGGVDASGLGSNTLMEFTAAAPTSTQSPSIRFVQGTADSANLGVNSASYPLSPRAYEHSGDIHWSGVMTATKALSASPTHSAVVIGAPNASSTGNINPLSYTQFGMSIAYRGRVMDEYYAPEATAHFSPTYVTPDYTQTTISTTNNRRDHLIQNISWIINRNSFALTVASGYRRGNDPIVGLALDSAATAGTAANTLSAGSTLPIVNTAGGVRGITLTAPIITSIQAALVAGGFPTTTTIATIDLATAGAATNVCDGIMLVALDRKKAFKDYIPQTKTRLEVGLISGFDANAVQNKVGSKAYEGKGQGAVLAQLYDATQGQRKYFGQHTQDPIINYPNPVTATETYVTYNLNHSSTNQNDVSNQSVSPKRAIFLVPSSSSTTITQLDAYLNAWLNSFSASLVTI